MQARARSSMDRASDYGSEGWGFNSLRARHHHMGHPAAIQDLKARLAGGPPGGVLPGAGGSGDSGGTTFFGGGRGSRAHPAAKLPTPAGLAPAPPPGWGQENPGGARIPPPTP